jgi:uncharacterized membrane protein HdeD (DUF308 family)
VRVSTTEAVEAQTASDSQLAPKHGLGVLGRAVIAAVAATVITFSADHSPTLGLVVFGVFAIATGIVLVVTALTTIARGSIRTLVVLHGAVAVATGTIALVSSSGDLATLILIVAAFASITGFIEFYIGLRSRDVLDVSRDWVFVGALTAALAVTAVLLPRDIRDPVVGVNGVEAYLTSSVIFVGLIGAYCAIVAVYLAIAGLSLTWARRPTAAGAADGVDRP